MPTPRRFQALIVATATGREYKPFEYYGHPQAERVIVLMGSAIGTCEEVVDELLSRGEKVGVLKVRLYRPFSAKHLLSVLPESVRSVAVLDRTKEPGAHAEPLYLDVMTALAEATLSEFWRTTETVRTRLCCMRCRAPSNWPVSSVEVTSMWALRSPAATWSATSTARDRGAVIERMSHRAAAMARAMASAATISRVLRAVA